MRNQEWNAALAKLHPLDLAQLIFSLLLSDAMHGEATLGIVDQAEVLASFINGDDVHETRRVGRVGAHFAVHLDQALHHDRLGLAAIERILEAELIC